MGETLLWHGPYSFEGLPECCSNVGLYLWTIPYHAGFLPHYVGKTNDRGGLGERLRIHATNLRRGRLHIPDFALYRAGRYESYKSFYVYCPLKGAKRTQEFSYHDLCDHIEGFLSHTRVFVCPLPGADESRLLELEAVTMWMLWDAPVCQGFICNEHWRRRPDLEIEHRAVNDANRLWGLTHPPPD